MPLPAVCTFTCVYKHRTCSCLWLKMNRDGGIALAFGIYIDRNPHPLALVPLECCIFASGCRMYIGDDCSKQEASTLFEELCLRLRVLGGFPIFRISVACEINICMFWRDILYFAQELLQRKN